MLRQRRLTLVTCCGVHALQDGLAALVYVLLPILAQTFGLGYAQVGTVKAVNRVAMAVFELPSGMLSERLGERSLLTFGLVCAGLGFLILAATSSYTVILLALFLTGAGAAFQHALASSAISAAFEGPGRRVALGTYNSSGDIGKLGITGLFTLVVGLGVAWQGLVGGLGALTLLAAFITYVVLRKVGAGAVLEHGAAGGADTPVQGWGLKNPTAFGALTGMVFFDSAVQAGFLTFLAFLMIEKEVPASLGAFAVVLTLTGGVFGKFICGFLAARLGMIRSLVLIECLTAAGIVALLALPPLPAYFVLPLVGVVLQGSSTITYGSVGDLVDEARRSRGFGLIYTTASIAATVAPLGFGLIADRFGLTTMMLTMACATLVPLLFCPLMRGGAGRSYV